MHAIGKACHINGKGHLSTIYGNLCNVAHVTIHPVFASYDGRRCCTTISVQCRALHIEPCIGSAIATLVVTHTIVERMHAIGKACHINGKGHLSAIHGNLRNVAHVTIHPVLASYDSRGFGIIAASAQCRVLHVEPCVGRAVAALSITYTVVERMHAVGKTRYVNGKTCFVATDGNLRYRIHIAIHPILTSYDGGLGSRAEE